MKLRSVNLENFRSYKKLNLKINSFFSSYQKRAINTIEIILDILNKKNSEIKKAWELNERHYGALTGLNKDEMMKKHGKKQVHIWRRSFDVPPPPMEKTNPNHPSKNKAYINIPTGKIPSCESLKNTFERVMPYYEKNIKPLLSSNKNILISAHGNSLRALCKKLLNISNKKIIELLAPLTTEHGFLKHLSSVHLSRGDINQISIASKGIVGIFITKNYN